MSDVQDMEAAAETPEEKRATGFGKAALTVAIIEVVLFVVSIALLVANLGVLVNAVNQLIQNGTTEAGQAVAVAGIIAVIMLVAFAVAVVLIGAAITLSVQAIGTGKGRKRGILALLLAISPLVLPAVLITIGVIN
ncbi:hypothetical protein [Microlunatus sp. GCM10028923]|uniref:hypothetical protein n=1 Tax=Microlunatus sp. GCM10028923 TaxID=3273400 RepID=UPI003612470D